MRFQITSEKRENTRLKLVQMLGGDESEQDRKLARQKYDALRASRRQNSERRQGWLEGGHQRNL